jgi:heavy metal sensor kinase
VDRIFEEELRPTLIVLGLGIPLGAALAGLGGYLLARRALAPIGRMAARAESISADRLSERLPVENPDDELGQLATVINRTFARLERSFELLRQFTADASHDLRTPLTALRSVGEVGLREPRTADEYREIVGSMLEETDRLTRLIDSLLAMSRADAGHVKLERETLDLGALAREAATYLGVLAEEKGQQLLVEGEAFVPVVADRLVLRQALVNLIDNAIKYSPANAPIRIQVSARDAHGVIAVCDEGPGIPVEHRERVFDRFHRVDRARARASGGSGLGLAIARWAVEANGGRIELETEEGHGCQFRIVLPLAST